MACCTQISGNENWEALMAQDQAFFENDLAPEAIWFFADGTSLDREIGLKDLGKTDVTKQEMGTPSLLKASDSVVMVMSRVNDEAVQGGKK